MVVSGARTGVVRAWCGTRLTDASIARSKCRQLSQPAYALAERTWICLFVTSARENLDAATLQGEPHAGDVFIYCTGASKVCPNKEYLP